MNRISKMESIARFNRERGQKTMHPLVAVLDQSLSGPVREERYVSELYIVFLKDEKCGVFKYGRNQYDYEEGTLLFISPGQVYGFEDNGKMIQPTGWALVFHPDLIHGTHLGRHIHEYGFFSYDANEALHISEDERKIVLECFNKIRYELERPIDKHSKTLIVSNIELFLTYCVRFYDRQFITREHVHKDVVIRLERLLKDYFLSGEAESHGLPSVAFCAYRLNLSPKYLGDLLKKETGKSAQVCIQEKIIDVAKEKMYDPRKSVSQVAYELGFKYPQHFTRFFKQHAGYTPNEFRHGFN